MNIDGAITVCVAANPYLDSAEALLGELLEKTAHPLESCDAFAFGAGPGRFSGLRLACGMIQGFAYAFNKPVVATPSLAALAAANYGAQKNKAVAALPAHREHIYLALCRRQTGVWQSPRPHILPVDAVLPGTAVRQVCGEAFLRYPALLQGRTLSEKMNAPDAAAIAELAMPMLQAGQTTTAMRCAPLYVRKKIAQTIKERQAQKAKKKREKTKQYKIAVYSNDYLSFPAALLR